VATRNVVTGSGADEARRPDVPARTTRMTTSAKLNLRMIRQVL
jgi:hypothetical protein